MLGSTSLLLPTGVASGTQVGATPAEVVLTFDQPTVTMGKQIIVTGPSGPVQAGPARLGRDTVTGTFPFTSTSAGSGTPPPATGPVPAGAGGGDPSVPVGGLVVLPVVVPAVAAAALVLVRRRRARSTAP